MRTCVRTLAVALVVTLASAATVSAQNAQISGSLKDETGAVLPGVTITAKNIATGLTRSSVSQPNGEYRIPALPPGTYTLTTELQGFAA